MVTIVNPMATRTAGIIITSCRHHPELTQEPVSGLELDVEIRDANGKSLLMDGDASVEFPENRLPLPSTPCSPGGSTV